MGPPALVVVDTHGLLDLLMQRVHLRLGPVRPCTMQQAKGVDLARVQDRGDPLEHVQDAEGITSDTSAANSPNRRLQPRRRPHLRQVASEAGVIGVVGAVPDGPRSARQHRVPDVAARKRPSASRDVLDGPLDASGAPLQDAVVLSVSGAALEEEGLERVDSTNIARVTACDTNLKRPRGRGFRRVVTKAEPLPDQNHIESHVRLTLRRGVKLRHEVVRIV
mmetsp:Transcript_45466/g.90128  ORF Transcript_45466/g.90128 Transcript_45466/m.90128 type:complete len:221 (+) Transcript_45466:223-885(+)